ncbi:MAG TPA: Spo0B domain-containing protein [Paenibacillus sp.]
MKRRFAIPTLFAMLVLTCLTSMYFIHSLYGFIIISLCLLILFQGYIRYIQRRAADERKHMLESVQRTATATLGHHRHDWMNDLQLIYGYLKLGKYDKLGSCVERIKEQMALESKISRLGIPALVFFLQSFREVNRSIDLRIEIRDELQLNHMLRVEDAEELTEAIVETIKNFQFMGRSSWDEVLELHMSLYQENGEVIAAFCPEGEAGNAEKLQRYIEEWHPDRRVLAERTDSNRFSCRLRVPMKSSVQNTNEVNVCL